MEEPERQGDREVIDLEIHAPVFEQAPARRAPIPRMHDEMIADALVVVVGPERAFRAVCEPIALRPLHELDNDVVDLLRVGLYQLLFMGSVPAYAAIAQTVELSKRRVGIGASKLVNAVLRRVGLEDSAHRRVREYSLGMRQRLAIALALLGEPRLLVLDEPSNGLDPAGIVEMRALLRELASDGVTVFVSSHLLAEMEQLATHVGVLQAGSLRFEGTAGELRARVNARLAIRCGDAARASALLTANGETFVQDGDTLYVTLSTRDEAQVNALLVANGIPVSHLAREHASLESLFFELTAARPAREAA